MFPLNLPSIDANIKQDGGKKLIFDPLRKRYVSLTPEEWVKVSDIGYVSDIPHFISQMPEHAHQDVIGYSRTCVPEVRLPIDRRPADIQSNALRMNRLKKFLL